VRNLILSRSCSFEEVCRRFGGTCCSFGAPLHSDVCWIELLVFIRLISRMQSISRAGKIWMLILGGHFTPRLSDKTIPSRCFPLAAPMQSKHICTYVRCPWAFTVPNVAEARVRGTAAGSVPRTPRITHTYTHTHTLCICRQMDFTLSIGLRRVLHERESQTGSDAHSASYSVGADSKAAGK
jgi:hypothetical protein